MSAPAPSARGLFRAMGKQAKPAARLDLDGAVVVDEEGLAREADDFYPTPPEPARALLAAERDHLAAAVAADGGRPVWEPACGDGALMREIAAAGFAVTGSDLVDRGVTGFPFALQSLFEVRAAPSGVAVTNPPFDLCSRAGAPFVTHLLDVLGLRYVALLLPLGWPGAASRAGLWQRRTPSIVYLMRWRIDFTGQGAPPMLNAWFVWDAARPAPAGQTRLAMLDRDSDVRQAEMFGGAQ